MSAGVTENLTFLADYFDAGKSYSMVNVARSLLSFTHSMTSGNNEETGRNPLITKPMSGIKNKRTSTPLFFLHRTRLEF